ncbi:dymeclin [Culicoides brevitarsis]|uniref:dymeclin n=1 Tax=Culicoides brevitarsis TaxID=469753 RepID=UPI00307B4BD5
MGINVSRQAELAENAYLKKFVGKNHIPVTDDEFWNTFLQYHINLPSTSQEQLNLDARLESLCQQFVANNLSTGNLGSLVYVFLTKVTELLAISEEESSVHVWQTFNALFMIRSVVKYLIETSSEYQLMQHFEAISSQQVQQNKEDGVSIDLAATEQPAVTNVKNVDGTRFENFFDAVINLIAVVPVKEHTYHLHLEAINMIIVLLSVHLFSPQPTDRSTIYKTVYKSPYANTVMSVLLTYVSKMMPVPANMFGITSGSSFVVGIAESLWNILTFTRKPSDILETEDLPTAFREHYPLSNQSLLLILILINHNTTKKNAYRDSLFGCTSIDLSEDDPSNVTFRIDFAQLYATLCRIVTIDQATLLLYILLHRNQKFYKFVMSQSNLQQLVTPILHTLYNGPDSTSHHIYMSLIVLLILSEDDGFNKSIHDLQLKNVAWYTEKYLSEISLGGLLILVVIRTIQYNMLKTRDKYLHTNCLAALANMSGQFRFLHPYVSQRLVGLFETLAKKQHRLSEQLKPPTTANGGDTSINMANTEDLLQDLSVLEEVLRMVLEILNSCLAHQLVYCPNLVYTLLYKRHVFEAFRSHPAFQDIIQNIDMVVGFFSSRLQRVQEQRGELGVSEVLEVISKGASQWSSDRLRKFPDLKFKYVEEDAPEEFFIPYVWSLVSKSGCVHFSSESIKSVTSEISC